MKIRWHGMAATLHSWSLVTQALAREMNNAGHSVHIKSTNGLEHFPDDLRHLLLPGYHGHPSQPELVFLDDDGSEVSIDRKKCPDDINDINRPYDLELAYTILYQIPRRFFGESRSKMVIWNFESSVLPCGWQEFHRGVDYILPSSQYSSDIFLNNGIPSSKLVVVPHGVDRRIFHPGIAPFPLHTKKRVKFLHNAIPHARKCHDRVLEAYLDAFTGDDDVCLVMKTKFLKPAPDKPFEVDVRAILENKMKGRANPPEIEIVTSFVDDIGSLYTACDAVVSMSSCEGFALPLLEALACGNVVIAPRHGGQLDFLNDKNSILVNTGEMKAPPSMQYWTHSKDAVVGDPSTKHCSELMRRVYNNVAEEKARVLDAANETVNKFSWTAAAKQITDLAEECLAQKHNLIPKTRKRKILYVIPYNMAGGGEVWVREAILRLDREKYEPTVAFPLGMSNELVSLFGDLGVNLENLSHRGEGNALKCLIEVEKYDIVHFYNSLQVYALLLRILSEGWGGKIVETVHSDLIWQDSMAKVATRRNVSMIVGVSETICTKLAKKGNKNVRYLPQQIAWEKFGLPKNKQVLTEIGCPTNRFVVGTIARLSPEKNIPIVLSCARALPEAVFVIVGSGPQENVLKKMASSLGNVIFVGRRTDTERFYAAFDAFLLPSAMEGLPLTILEAFASGVPVVASNVGAIPEVVLDGVNGFIVRGGTDRYVDAIKKLCNPEQNTVMSKHAFDFAKELMGKDNAGISDLYDSMFT